MKLTHPKRCECLKCLATLVKRTSDLWEANGCYATPQVGKTVLVRSYFRSGPRRHAPARALNQWIRKVRS